MASTSREGRNWLPNNMDEWDMRKSRMYHAQERFNIDFQKLPWELPEYDPIEDFVHFYVADDELQEPYGFDKCVKQLMTVYGDSVSPLPNCVSFVEECVVKVLYTYVKKMWSMGDGEEIRLVDCFKLMMNDPDRLHRFLRRIMEEEMYRIINPCVKPYAKNTFCGNFDRLDDDLSSKGNAVKEFPKRFPHFYLAFCQLGYEEFLHQAVLRRELDDHDQHYIDVTKQIKSRPIATIDYKKIDKMTQDTFIMNQKMRSSFKAERLHEICALAPMQMDVIFCIDSMLCEFVKELVYEALKSARESGSCSDNWERDDIPISHYEKAWEKLSRGSLPYMEAPESYVDIKYRWNCFNKDEFIQKVTRADIPVIDHQQTFPSRIRKRANVLEYPETRMGKIMKFQMQNFTQ